MVEKNIKNEPIIEETPREEKRNIYALSAAAFFNDTGSDMLTPIYSTFLTIVLGLNPWIIGLLDSLSRLIGALIRPIAGKVSDLKGRKPFIWIGYIGLFLSRALQALAGAWPHLIGPKMLYELGRGVRNPAREALISEDIAPKKRGWAFGLLQTADSLGAILGPTLGYLFYFLLSNYFWNQESSWMVILDHICRSMLLITAAPTIVSIFIILFFIKEKRKNKLVNNKNEKIKNNLESPKRVVEVDNQELQQKDNNGKTFDKFKRKSYIYMIIIVVLLSLAIPTESLLLGLAQKRYNYSGDVMFMLFFFYNVFYALSALPAGILSDRFGGRIIFLISSSLLIIYGILSAVNFSGSFYFTIPTLVVFGLFSGGVYPPMMKMITGYVPEKRRAELLGTFSMFKTGAEIGSPFLLGLIFEPAPYAPYIVIAILGFVVFLMIALAKKILG